MPAFESLSNLRNYKRLFFVAAFVIVLDQLTKLWAMHTISPGTYINPPPIPVIDGLLYWVHIYNTGAAWGSFSGSSYILGVLAVVALIVIYVFRKQLELQLVSRQYLIGLLCGGIIGNFIDRVWHGHVVDFIDVHLPFYRWPAFNLADSAISVSVCVFIILSFLPKKKAEE